MFSSAEHRISPALIEFGVSSDEHNLRTHPASPLVVTGILFGRPVSSYMLYGQPPATANKRHGSLSDPITAVTEYAVIVCVDVNLHGHCYQLVP